MSLLHACKKILLSILLLIFSFATSAEVTLATYQVAAKKSQSIGTPKLKSFDEDSFYQALIAEFYNRLGSPELTLNYYLPLALSSVDPALVKRVTEIATGSGQLKKGLEVSKHWVNLEPESLEARQYLTLLLLRDGQLKRSAEQLPFVRRIIEAGQNKNDRKIVVSNGLKFIGALLAIEAHHKKALSVFELYLDQHSDIFYAQQQNLILASLAMKAKKYQVVVSSLKGIEDSNSPYFASAGLMKSKALQKLGKQEQAAALIKLILETDKASDSLRLELARLLIGIGEKKEAAQLLKSLIVKYPDNFDLLKSLIALDIEQHNWLEAKTNNKKLLQSGSYDSDAYYLYGEIYEAESSFESALSFFKKVAKGPFLKRSHSKIAFLIKRLRGLKSAKQWLHVKQQQSKKIKDKAHWLKLEADILVSDNVKADKLELKEALKIYNTIIMLRPNKLGYHYYRGLLYERLDQIVLAEQDFTHVLNKRKDDADTSNALGFLLLKHTKRFAEAKKHIVHAFKLKPNDPSIIDSLAWFYYQTGEIKIAEDMLRKAYKMQKKPEIADHLVKVLSKSGLHLEAKMIIDEMKKKYPERSY